MRPGLLPLFNLSYSVGQIHKYSVAFYKTLEAETGQNVGFRQVSNIRLARTEGSLGRVSCITPASPRTIGVDVNMLTPAEVKEIWPLCETDGIIGAIQHPEDGYIQPADLTQALAKGARDRGAEINRYTTVTGDRAAAVWRMAGQDRQGRHHLRAHRLGDRQFRPPDRRDGRARHSGHPGRAPIHRHRAASGDRRAPEGGPARDGRAARERIPPGTCARRMAACCSAPTRRARPACYVDGPSPEVRI